MGAIAGDNRRFIDAVFWILRTGAPWRDLPPEYGGWRDTHRRFIRWRDKAIWVREKLLEVLIDEAGYEWLIDAGYCRFTRTPSGQDQAYCPFGSKISWLHYPRPGEVTSCLAVSGRTCNAEAKSGNARLEAMLLWSGGIAPGGHGLQVVVEAERTRGRTPPKHSRQFAWHCLELPVRHGLDMAGPAIPRACR